MLGELHAVGGAHRREHGLAQRREILAEGQELGEDLVKRIKTAIRENTTPRHVPAKIVAVPDIPRTKSGKIVELAVRSVVHGEAVRNTDALANPEALEHFRDVAELRDD